jgi:hypothetical protein
MYKSNIEFSMKQLRSCQDRKLCCTDRRGRRKTEGPSIIRTFAVVDATLTSCCCVKYLPIRMKALTNRKNRPPSPWDISFHSLNNTFVDATLICVKYVLAGSDENFSQGLCRRYFTATYNCSQSYCIRRWSWRMRPDKLTGLTSVWAGLSPIHLAVA